MAVIEVEFNQQETMKLFSLLLTTLSPSIGFVCLLGLPASAQLADGPGMKAPLAPGAYHSAQRPGFPPLPWNPFPDLPLYSWAERQFIYDDREVDYQLLKSEAADRPVPLAPAVNRSALLASMGDCASELRIIAGSNFVTLLVTNATAGKSYDLFTTSYLLGDSITNSFWRRLAKATNGQGFTFSTYPCSPKFFVLGCDTDTDGDGLTDAYEALVTKTSPTNQHSVNALYTDREMENIQVNDPDQDCGNEQNTQFESTVAVLGSNVIVAYVDSNRGVYGLGDQVLLSDYTPRFVGYAVSTNGGLTFADKDVPPLDAAGFGDAGDPVLAVDTSSNLVYLVGTSPRQEAAHKGVPFWKSTDGGLTFGGRTNIHEEIMSSDKPWIAVDDWPGTGRHDLYVTCTGKTNPGVGSGLWMAVSRDGQGGNWTNAAMPVRELAGTNVTLLNSPIIQIGPDHVGYFFWFERSGTGASATNWLKMCKVQNRGASLGEVQVVRPLATTHPVNGNLELKRSNTATNDDTFRVFPFPVVAVNPDTNKASHLYVAYADQGTNTGEKADVFLVCSTNRGTNWTAPLRVNSDQTTNDQWMPVLAVKPDGTKLFLGWYDRRNDTNNSLIDVYGRFGSIETNGSVSFTTEFRISSVSFPPVFAGTLPENTLQGHYDPAYPPKGVNLHWWYPEWPAGDEEENRTFDTYRNHVGEYNGAAADASSVLMTWTDGRLSAVGAAYAGSQRDIRMARLSWPQ